MRVVVLGIASALAGCAAAAERPEPAPAAVESISFETGPCFGACPVYKVVVRSDGSGEFEGRRFTAVTGTRTFTVSPGQYRAFARQLVPLRPASGKVSYSGDSCRSMATDLPSASIEWSGGRGIQSIYFYFGCDMAKNVDIANRISGAPDLLPIGAFIRDPRQAGAGEKLSRRDAPPT